MKKAALHNLGCKVNSYETEAMQQLLEEHGYEIVPFHDCADVYIINTCSVTNIADRKSRQMLHRAKKQNPEAVVVAAGCYVQAAAKELEKDAAVDLIIGNNKKTELIPILESFLADRGEQKNRSHLIEIGETGEYETLRIKKIADHTRAFIKVQDGCNQFCSYCIIPYTRGRVRSREAEDVRKEVQELAAGGYREIVLTGIHLSSYGLDLQHGENLLELIRSLHDIEGLERIRLGSLEPRIVTEAFANALASMEKVCPHFHLSLQSGCNETLARMNRRYSTEEYEACCGFMRKAFHNPAITTDVIVGFPGETEAEFEQTKAYLERIHFYEMHIFKYSKREGTRAAQMTDQVPEQIKTFRSEALLALERQMSAEFRQSLLGQERDVLLEEEVTIEGIRYMTGYTREYVKAVVPFAEGNKNMVVKGRLERILTEDILLVETSRQKD